MEFTPVGDGSSQLTAVESAEMHDAEAVNDVLVSMININEEDEDNDYEELTFDDEGQDGSQDGGQQGTLFCRRTVYLVSHLGSLHTFNRL
jgi:hypothetical protein